MDSAGAVKAFQQSALASRPRQVFSTVLASLSCCDVKGNFEGPLRYPNTKFSGWLA